MSSSHPVRSPWPRGSQLEREPYRRTPWLAALLKTLQDLKAPQDTVGTGTLSIALLDWKEDITMRLPALLCLVGLVHATAAAPLRNSTVFGSDVHGHHGRDEFDGFKGFLGPLDKTELGATHEHIATDSPTLTATSILTSTSVGSTASSGSALSTETRKAKETASLATSHSLVGTSTQPTRPITAPEPAPSAPSPSSSPSAAEAVNAASKGGGGTSEWKIIGVAVIAFSAVAAILLLAVFFDHWWRFVRDLFGRKRDANAEELVPDWEKAEWELRLEDRHRYPSFSSLPSLPVVNPTAQCAAKQIQSPPQAAVAANAVRRDGQAQGRVPVRQLDGTLGPRSPSALRLSMSSSGHAGAGVGLGLGRVGSVNRSVTSPRLGGHGRSPTPQHTPRLGYANPGTRGGGNPFDDTNGHSPMPEDVYGGMA
ncbi:hypothetical protein OH76DRAFT_1481825 [Lentinus brumalis]|uniref:Uncharacterized protein n=1 Tax=Lentinus brumalis TaxID=2498619 RepID=A0A371DF34_9APHY|nr:hypothetical protein OH76DRAFT_1481825 [Polyporus brumalis]